MRQRLSLRRGEGAGYFDKPAVVGSSPTSSESCCSSEAEQRKNKPEPLIPAAKSSGLLHPKPGWRSTGILLAQERG